MAAKHHSSAQHHHPPSPVTHPDVSSRPRCPCLQIPQQRNHTIGLSSKPSLFFRTQCPLQHVSSQPFTDPLLLVISAENNFFVVSFRAGCFPVGLANHVSSVQDPASAMCRFAPTEHSTFRDYNTAGIRLPRAHIKQLREQMLLKIH